MRLLLLQDTVYLPGFGANKGNRLLLEALAARGHACQTIVPAKGTQADANLADILQRRAISSEATAERIAFSLNRVEVRAYSRMSNVIANAAKEIAAFAPDWILVSSEDFGQQLLRVALATLPGRVVFMARTTQLLPFGSASFWPNQSGSDLIKKVRGIVAVSRFVADYIERHLGMKAAVLPLPSFGAGPFPNYSSFDSGYVLMINPCAVKGISIFLQVARALPEVSFAAVPTWGTTETDRAALEALTNITVLKPSEDIDEIYAKTRIVLVPSLWEDTYPKVPIEAMLRGLPVLASDIGGLPEAKLGVDYVLPVHPIKEYAGHPDARMIPSAVVPPQNITPWVETLQALLSDRNLYDRISQASRKAAHDYIAQAGVEKFEAFLKSLDSSTPPRPPS